jgi:dTDP-L-rhamnose 4-epimerase
MKVLVTGSEGFIGSRVVALLRARGHEVSELDRRATTPIDLRNDDLDQFVDGVEVVCHQAAMVGNGVDAQDLPGYASHNDVGTARLLAAMARVGAGRLVLASSMVVYGDGLYDCPTHGVVPPATRVPERLAAGDFEPGCPVCAGPITWTQVDEQSPFRPRTSYAASKVAQEHYADAWCTLQAGRVIALRYHNVYGPGLPANTPYAGVAAIFRSALERGEAPQVFEDGQQMRDFVHVDDVAVANAQAVEQVADHPHGVTPYNVASGIPFTIGQMAEVLSDAYGGQAPVVTGDFRPYDVRHVVASPQRAIDGLGFRAAIRPEEGIARLAAEPLG